MVNYLENLNATIRDFCTTRAESLKERYMTHQEVLPTDNIFVSCQKNIINRLQPRSTEGLSGLELAATNYVNMGLMQLNPAYRMSACLYSISGDRKGLLDLVEQFYGFNPPKLNESNLNKPEGFVLPERLPQDWESRQKIFQENGGTGFLG